MFHKFHIYLKDIDECMDGTADCIHLCNNTIGSYVCGCDIGYQLDGDGVTCIDINECASNNTEECEDKLVKRSLPYLTNRRCSTEGNVMYYAASVYQNNYAFICRY